ncbi:unnamed protein product [Brachionus calyciflorus]|uniref:ISXO2-like transposase domain-containing protein n=1 Tax=Brachionus calyciflorus TaxID=104777 RepID=A0A814QFU4_9BILA|nr:unnamed protein product [Brachionus calyciflorus]
MELPKNNQEFYDFLKNKKNVLTFIKKYELALPDIECTRPACKDSKENFDTEILANRIIFRCKNKGCRQHYTARSEVFSLNKTSNLAIEKILEIYWYWSHDHSVNYTANQTNLNEKTIINWFKKIRSCIYDSMLELPQMGGDGYRIQIDESLFQGKRKYNRGRLLKSDIGSKKTFKKKNYGDRVQGPWVFGLVCQKISDIEKIKENKIRNKGKIKNYIKKIKEKDIRKNFFKDKRKVNNKSNRIYKVNRSYSSTLVKNLQNIRKEVRMFVVEKRDAATLIPLIKKNCKIGSEIVSDEWSSYRQ